MTKRATDVAVRIPTIEPAHQGERPVSVTFQPHEAEALLRLAIEGAAVLQLNPKILDRVALRRATGPALSRLAAAIRIGDRS